jgi:hypothetical protein
MLRSNPKVETFAHLIGPRIFGGVLRGMHASEPDASQCEVACQLSDFAFRHSLLFSVDSDKSH